MNSIASFSTNSPKNQKKKQQQDVHSDQGIGDSSVSYEVDLINVLVVSLPHLVVEQLPEGSCYALR